MNSIAVYQFRQPFVRRRFELFKDSIRVTGSSGNIDFDITVPLARLDACGDRVWVYGTMVYVGYFVLIVAVLLLMVLATYVEMQENRVSFVTPLVSVVTLGSIGLGIALWNRRKIEHVQFRLDAGVAIFAIPRDGKNSGDFDRFVSLLVEQIGQVRGNALSE